MKTKLFLLALAATLTVQAQKVQVMQVVSLPETTPFYYPQLNADGTQLLLTNESYQGLTLYNLDKQTKQLVSNDMNAGYEPIFNSDGSKLFFRSSSEKDGRRFTAVKTYNIDAQKEQLVMKADRNVGKLQHYTNGVIVAKNEKLFKVTFGKKTETVPTYVSNEDLKLILYKNGKRTELNPYNEENINYIWSSISPDGTKILFNSKYGTAVCDLNGKIIKNFGHLNAPVWYDNNMIVGMYDKDNGHFITGSTIAIASLDGKINQELTDGKEITMYPSVAPKANKIAYNTIDGKIYIMTIKF